MNLTVCGSFGFRNAGDEAVPLAISDLAGSMGMSLETVQLSRYEKPDLEEIVGLGGRDKSRREELKDRTRLYIGGGIIEPNEHCVFLKCEKYAAPGRSAQRSLFAASVEFDVKYGWLDRYRIRRAAESLQYLYVRDVLSAEMLQDILPGRTIEVVGDSVLQMQPAATTLPELYHIGPYIAVSLAPRWQNDPDWHRWISTELALTAGALGAAIVFVPMSVKYDSDLPAHHEAARGIREAYPDIRVHELKQELPPRMISRIFGDAALVISMRLHGAVMAYAQQSPFIALSYHPKLQGFAKTVGLEDYCLPRMLPSRQSKNVYGYNFRDLGLEKYRLAERALHALEETDFSALNSLIMKQRSAFTKVLETQEDSVLKRVG